MANEKRSEQLFRRAELAEAAGEMKSVFNLLTRAAHLGNTGAQVNLGNFYASGTATEQDFEKAAKWYTSAYRNGGSSGANNLAIDLRNQGKTKEAILWFKRAVALNDGDAAVELAKLLKDQPNGSRMAIKYLKQAISMKRCNITDDGKAKAKRLLRKLETTADSTRTRQGPPRKPKNA